MNFLQNRFIFLVLFFFCFVLRRRRFHNYFVAHESEYNDALARSVESIYICFILVLLNRDYIVSCYVYIFGILQLLSGQPDNVGI